MKNNITTDFFNEYKTLFLNLTESLRDIISKNEDIKTEFENKGISSVDFAKKLLGQIVFIYFLQKKGWMSVVKDEQGNFKKWGTGSKKFMRILFDKKIVDYDNFFNDILEYLFYEALATKRDNNYYSRFKCKIPFLNGGLFEPLNNYDWKRIKIILDNNIFDNILETFDRFNFTIKENEFLEKEDAVNPEMLGKVFENLLDVKDRKSKGAFYTPKEIVHYMCQQSLINYLEINTTIDRKDIEKFLQLKEDLVLPETIKQDFKKVDILLKEIKVTDPAVGSGAFLIGMLNEIVKARSILSIYFNEKRNNYDLKREIIENCLYGVDIESSAVDITKLRLWLSLIVDEIDYENNKLLPNLDYKIMCGNSLLEEFKGVKLIKDVNQITLIQSKSKQKINSLKLLQKQLFNEPRREIKKQLKAQINQIEWDLIEETLKEQGSKDAIQELKKYKKNKSKPFFLWELYFIEVFDRKNPGFDVVIANPPYLRQEKLKEFKDIFKKNYKIANGTADLYCYFFELSYNLLRKKGINTFITSDKYIKANYANELREFLNNNTIINQIIDFGGYKIFESANVNTSIIIFKKEINTNNIIKVVVIDKEEKQKLNLNQYINNHFFTYNQSNLTNDNWNLVNSDIIEITKKIKINTIKLKEYCCDGLRRGIETDFDKAYILNKNQVDDIIKENKFEKKLFIPYIKGKNVKRWKRAKKDFLLLFPYEIENGKLNLVNIDNYPNTKKYLKQYKKQLKNRAGIKGKKLKWYTLNCNISLNNKFKTKKIIFPRISAKGNFTWDEEKLYLNNSVCFIPNANKYLLALLNSNLYLFYFKQILSYLGSETMEYTKQYVNQTPIKEISFEQQKPFIKLVNQILLITESNNYLDNDEIQEEIKELEEKINQLIYKLYSLTSEEIKIIEEFNNE